MICNLKRAIVSLENLNKTFIGTDYYENQF